MKKLILILTCCAINVTLFSQFNDTLYFISATPEMSYRMEPYPSLLFRLEKDTMIIVDKFKTGKKMYPEFVRVYPEKEITFIQEANLLSQNRSLRVIEHKDASDLKAIHNYTDDINPWPVPILRGGEFIFVSIDEINVYKGINRNLEQVTISPEDFKNLYICGNPGFPLPNGEYQNVIIKANENILRIPVTSNINERPEFPIKLPDKYKNDEKRMRAIIVNTDNVFVIRIWNSSFDSIINFNGKTKFLIYNKKLQNWNEYAIAGDRTTVRAINNWVFGSVAFDNSAPWNSPEFKVSPGASLRFKGIDKYGPGFDVMARRERYYFPGILYIYNTLTNTSITWETGQGDSEILYIIDNKIIYRKVNAIFTREILSNNELGKPELILKDDRIRNIHWCFSSYPP